MQVIERAVWNDSCTLAGMSQRIRGVIFDVDGTLVNSNDAHARAWVEALQESGIEVQFAAVRKLIGMGGDKLLPALADIESDSKLGKQVSEKRGEIFARAYLPKLEAFPKSFELVHRVREAGMKPSVASSAEKSELKALLTVAGVQDSFESAASSSDAHHSKPDPDIVQAALDALGFEPSRVVMIGDTPYDIEAATRAGIGCIAFRCGGRSDHDLAGALAIYDGPADLLSHFAGSPLAE